MLSDKNWDRALGEINLNADSSRVALLKYMIKLLMVYID